jgi:hypothetical protein
MRRKRTYELGRYWCDWRNRVFYVVGERVCPPSRLCRAPAPRTRRLVAAGGLPLLAAL